MNKLITTILLPKDLPVVTNRTDLYDSRWQNTESEASANFLMRFAQQRGNWDPFTKVEIDAFSKHDFWFNKLTTYGDIVVEKVYKIRKLKEPKLVEGDLFTNEFYWEIARYHFTDSFIIECQRLLSRK